MNYKNNSVQINFNNNTQPSPYNAVTPSQFNVMAEERNHMPNIINEKTNIPEVAPEKPREIIEEPRVEQPHNGDFYSVDEAFVKGNISPTLYRGYKNFTPVMPATHNEREKLLLDLSKQFFYAHELNLFLDIYPNNEKVISMYNQHKEQGMKLMKEYEKKYGAISLEGEEATKHWNWIDSPWPWQ